MQTDGAFALPAAFTRYISRYLAEDRPERARSVVFRVAVFSVSLSGFICLAFRFRRVDFPSLVRDAYMDSIISDSRFDLFLCYAISSGRGLFAGLTENTGDSYNKPNEHRCGEVCRPLPPLPFTLTHEALWGCLRLADSVRRLLPLLASLENY